VIADCSIKDEASVRARRIVECFHDNQADKIVGERNYGGDNIPALVAQVATDDRVPYEMVKEPVRPERRSIPTTV
jgi:phage terminase large subunit-like protein